MSQYKCCENFQNAPGSRQSGGQANNNPEAKMATIKRETLLLFRGIAKRFCCSRGVRLREVGAFMAPSGHLIEGV